VQYKAVKPVGDRVLVKVDKEEQRSVGGVLLPTAAQSRPTAGSVVAAGDVSMVKVGVVVMTSSCQMLARPVECRQHQQCCQSSRHSDLACNSSTTVQLKQTDTWLQLHAVLVWRSMCIHRSGAYSNSTAADTPV
jgi:hypothetical protein